MRPIALVAAALLACHGGGQAPVPPAPPPAPAPRPPTIVVRPRYDIGEPIVLAIADLPPKAAVVWKLTPDAKTLDAPARGKRHAWAKVGAYTVEATVVSIVKDGPDYVPEVTQIASSFVVGEPPPPPPPPGPLPGDPLVDSLRQAYRAETDPAKASQAALLVALYKQSGPAARDNKALATWGDLHNAIADVAKSLGVAGKLPTVQGIAAGELKARVPYLKASDLPLDAAGRALCVQVFGRVADALAVATRE